MEIKYREEITRGFLRTSIREGTAFTLSPLRSVSPSETKTSITARQNSFLQDTVIPPYPLRCQTLPNSQYTTATGLDHGLIGQITWVLLTIDLVIWARVHFCCQNRTQPERAWEQIVCTSVCLRLLQVKDFSCYLDLRTVITTKHLNPK